MGCDDALEVEEFVAVGDSIDDMSSLSVEQLSKIENLNKILIR
jgi:hypothetical protein